MLIDRLFIRAREACYEYIETWNMNFANFMGFPDNPGMPYLPRRSYLGLFNLKEYGASYKDLLPRHVVQYPPDPMPFRYLHILFRTHSAPAEIPRTYLESADTGFYGYYIPDYKNLIFLPDFISEYLQIQQNFCLDIGLLEAARACAFKAVLAYSFLVSVRSVTYWFVELNPYEFPFIYLCAICDWFEESYGQYIPNLFGLNMSITVFNYLIGRVGDFFNHIVFTMPFLPSEGVRSRAYIDMDIGYIRTLEFKYLPYLWYKYPIPDEIRQFWLLERPDILTYMQKSYGKIGINFLPDAALKYANENPNLNIQSIPFQKLSSKIASQLRDITLPGSYLDIPTPDELGTDLDDIIQFIYHIKDHLHIF